VTAQIVLVRHGASAHVHRDWMIDHDGIQTWRDEYDSAGIKSNSQPSTRLLHIADGATHIVASDLLRAVESAERLAPQREIEVSNLLREVPLKLPHWPTPLPLIVWEFLIHVAWSYRIVRGIDSTEQDRARAAAAAKWLGEIVTNESTALVVTHGVFRRLLAQQLLLAGWTSAGRRGGYSHWSFWTFARPVR
jgi:broad specificity phosphatase PhoE